MNKIFKNTAIYALGEILPKIISFLLLPVFTRYLSTTEYGIISYTSSFMLLFMVIGTLSLNSYALRFYFEHKKEKERKHLLGSVYMTIALVNVVLLGIGWLVFPAIISRYNIQVPWHPYFQLALINNFLVSFSIVPQVIYRVRQDSARYVALNFSYSMLTFLFNIIFVVFLKKGILGYYYSTLLVSIPYFFIYANIIRKYACFKLSKKYITEGLRFSLPLLPGAIAYFFLNMADRIILERNVPLSEIGIYNIAVTLTGALGIIIQSGYHAIEPEIFNHYGSPNYYDFVKKAQTIYFSAIYILALIIALFSQEVFIIMTGPSFHEGYYLVPILTIGVVMSGQNVIYGGVLASEKRTKVQGAISVSGAAFSILFNLLLIPFWGTIAAATSRMTSYIIMNTLLFIAMTFPGKKIYKESISVILILLIPHVIFTIFPSISVISTIIKIAILLIFIVYIMKVFNVRYLEVKGMFFKNRISRKTCMC